MVGIIFVYIDTVFGFYWHSFFMLNWMFQHDYLDTCFFAHLVCVRGERERERERERECVCV